MLYKFKSRITGDVIMLQPNGQHVLGIIGKFSTSEPSNQGILLPDQMPQALAALEAAIAQEEAARAAAVAQARADNLTVHRAEVVSLRQRALPFMEMIRECMKANEAITWGV